MFEFEIVPVRTGRLRIRHVLCRFEGRRRRHSRRNAVEPDNAGSHGARNREPSWRQLHAVEILVVGMYNRWFGEMSR